MYLQINKSKQQCLSMTYPAVIQNARGKQENPLFRCRINAKLRNRRMKSLSQKDIESILEPTGYSPSLHFCQRVSQKKGAKDDRWGSMGVSNGYDFALFLGKGILDRDNRGDFINYIDGVKIPVNLEKKRLITITYK